MMHQFNPNEGNGQSHTYCGAAMTREAYAVMLDAVRVSTCERCDSIAREVAIYEYWNDI